jgi:DnaJ-class molecular chaperone
MNKAAHSEPSHVTKTARGEDIHSNTWGTVFCPNCSGSGNYFYVDRGASRCDFCEGLGLIRVEKDRLVDRNEMPQLLS